MANKEQTFYSNYNYQHGVPTNVCFTLSLVMSPPLAMNALTPKSAICIEPSRPRSILPAFMSLYIFE